MNCCNTLGSSINNHNKNKDVIFGEYLPRVNEALFSDYGYKKINSLYVQEMETGAQHVETVIGLMKNAAAKEFYDSNLGRVLLFDYHNQYCVKLNGRFLKDYINGDGKEHFATKKKIFSPKDEYTIADHINYIRSTEQYAGESINCKNRSCLKLPSILPKSLVSFAGALSTSTIFLSKLRRGCLLLEQEEEAPFQHGHTT